MEVKIAGFGPQTPREGEEAGDAEMGKKVRWQHHLTIFFVIASDKEIHIRMYPFLFSCPRP